LQAKQVDLTPQRLASNPGSGIHDLPATGSLFGRSGGQSVANPGGLPWLFATATGTDAAVGSTSSGAGRRLCGSTESQRTPGEEHDARAEPSVAGDTIRGMDSISSRGATAMIARPPIGKVAA
jgi:hypothetical protein